MSPRAVIVELLVVAVLAGGLAWWWKDSGAPPPPPLLLLPGGEIGRTRDSLHQSISQSALLLAYADEAGLLAAWLPPERDAQMPPEERAAFEACLRAAAENIRRSGLAQSAIQTLNDVPAERYKLDRTLSRAIREQPQPAGIPADILFGGTPVPVPPMPAIVWVKIGDRWVPENLGFLQYFLDLDAAAEKARTESR